MKIRIKISFVGYLLVALVESGNGIMYLLASKIMPYHLTAMGSSWENLSPGIQIMSLNFMKAAGTGFLTTGIAMLFLLLIPFRKGEPWANWALLIISLNEILNIMLRTLEVSAKTSSNPPLFIPIITGTVVVISFLLSLGVNKNKRIS